MKKRSESSRQKPSIDLSRHPWLHTSDTVGCPDWYRRTMSRTRSVCIRIATDEELREICDAADRLLVEKGKYITERDVGLPKESTLWAQLDQQPEFAVATTVDVGALQHPFEGTSGKNGKLAKRMFDGASGLR